ncbi:MAG: SUMF1/EgtB/PvdO family nonheme iron enzyme [Anaerolineae bacterium]
MEQVSRLPEMERPSPYNTDLVVSALFTQWKCPAMIRFGITVLLIIGGVSLLSFSNLPSEPNNYHLILPTAAATEAVTAEATQAIFPMLTSVTHNADWTPVEQDFDGVTMVLVPAGCFDMGSDDGRDEEKPVNRQCFDEPFWIDTYEVTQAQFTLSRWDAGQREPIYR